MDICHTSVMLHELLEHLIPKPVEGLMIDCTLGEGGHTEAFLKAYPLLRVIGIDRDADILEKAIARLAPFADRFTPVNAWFDEFLADYSGEQPLAVLFDFGISSYHYEASNRGFSFKKHEPLDMRLNGNDELTVGQIINSYRQERLADIIYQFGEERYSRRIAAAICQNRPIVASDELAQIIWKAVPAAYRYGSIHPATKTFQALRIAVNRELERIVPALDRAIDVLSPGGRIGAISFHSLEDRLVKQLFRQAAIGCSCPPQAPRCICEPRPKIRQLSKKPLIPSEEECNTNPPSRSAKLRLVEKLEVTHA